MKLRELLAKVETMECRVSLDTRIHAVTSDSRKVRKGDLFVAFRGLRHDGASFAAEAIDRGAVAVVCEEESDVPREKRITVPDARLALGWLVAARAGYPSGKIVVSGITGTNGKTTTAGLLSAFLRKAGHPTGLMSTVQYEIGDRTIPARRTTPEATELQSLLSQMREAGCTHTVMEVSSHALDQQRTAGIQFKLGLFTNLTRDHLDYHGDMEAYFSAKKKLFQELAGSPGSLAVINEEDPFGCRLVEEFQDRTQVVTFGIDSGNFRVRNLSLSSSGSRFTLVAPDGSCQSEFPLPGRFNVYNMLGAVAAARSLDVPMEVIRDVLPLWFPRWGRMERVETGRQFGKINVFVDYAHTDDALSHVLKTLRELTPGRLIAVFGCGGDRDRGKRPLMGKVASLLADTVIVTSDNPRSEKPEDIIGDILKGVPEKATRPIVVVDRREAIARALATARSGDSVLVAGKGHEPYQELAHSVIPFDDREVIRSLVNRE